MVKTFFVCAAFSLVLVIQSGYAEEKRNNDSTITTLEEVVVSATKTREKRKDISNSVIIIDSMDIEESPAQNVGELLANELGIDWRTYGNYGGAPQSIRIRGMDSEGTQVLVNGIEYNSPSLGYADVNRIPMNNIDRIEVVKGSGSLLYGSGAMGGVVNIITKRAEREKMDLRVTAGFGNKDTYRLSVEQGMYVHEDFSYFLAANRRDTDGFRDNSDSTQTDVSLNLVFDQGDDLEISLYTDYIERESGSPGVHPPEDTNAYYIDEVKFYSPTAASVLDNSEDENAHIVFRVKGNLREWARFNFKRGYTDMEYYFYTRYNSSGKGGEFWTDNEVNVTEGTLDINPFEGASMLIGADHKSYDWANRSLDLDQNGRRVRDSKEIATASVDTHGAFAEVQYRPCKFLKLLAGIRNEDHSVFGTTNLSRYGLVVNPLEDTVLKFNHGKHFKAPTPNDLFWPFDGFSEGNPDLKPEKGWHTDMTLEQSLFKNNLFITLTYFKWDLNNKIQWEPNSDGVWTPLNLRKYEADGYEIGAKVGPFYDLMLCLNYTYTDADEVNKAYSKQSYFPPDFQYKWVKRRAAYTPEKQFKGSLTWWSRFGLTASATARYTGSRMTYKTWYISYPDPETETRAYKLKDYWTFDARVDQRLFDHWIFSIQCNNWSDRYYDTYRNTFDNQETGETSIASYPGAGRTVFCGITYEY